MGLSICTPKTASERRIDEIIVKKTVPLVTLLLLGAGESGKTTVLRQMILQEKKSFDPNYKLMMRQHILYNILEGVQVIVKGAVKKNITFSSAEAIRSADLFLIELDAVSAPKPINNTAGAIAKRALDEKKKAENNNNNVNMENLSVSSPGVSRKDGNNASMIGVGVNDFDARFAKHILVLINDPVFGEMVRTLGAQLHLHDGWPYFMEQFKSYPRWGGPKWVPSDNDVLHARVRTTGAKDERISINGLKVKVIDVGGQLNERGKWLRLFSNIDAVIYLMSLSDYNQTLFEEDKTNRLEDAIDLWQQTVNNQIFIMTTFVVLLNKKDLLIQKFCRQGIPFNSGLKSRFGFDVPVYASNKSDEENVAVVVNWFQAVMNSKLDHPKTPTFHVTTALAKETQTVVMNAIFVDVMEQAMGMLPTAA